MRTITDWCFAAATLVAADRRAMRRDWCPRWAWGVRAHVAGTLYDLAEGRALRRIGDFLDRPFAEPGMAVALVVLGAVVVELWR